MMNGWSWIILMKLKIWMKLGMTLTLGLQINQEWVKEVGQDDVRLGKGKESTTRTQKEKIQLSTWIPTFGTKIFQESWVFKIYKMWRISMQGFLIPHSKSPSTLSRLVGISRSLLCLQAIKTLFMNPTRYFIFQALTISSFYCKYST